MTATATATAYRFATTDTLTDTLTVSVRPGLTPCRCGRLMQARAVRCRRCNQKALFRGLALRHEHAGRREPANAVLEAAREQRILRYAARAALRLPLFEDRQDDC